MKKEILIGFIVGLIATSLGFYLYVEFALKGTFQEALNVVIEKELYGKILSLAAIPNLLAFFMFLKRKLDYRARGVLLATFLVAILILLSQFF